MPRSSKERPPRLFFSHSSEDKTLLRELVEAARIGLNLNKGDIRCSSLDGYDFASSDDIVARVRTDGTESNSLIAIITPSNLRSNWGLFELGARWGFQGYFAVVVAGGADFKDLPEPVKMNRARRCVREDLESMFMDVADQLDLRFDLPSARRHLDAAEKISRAKAQFYLEAKKHVQVSPHTADSTARVEILEPLDETIVPSYFDYRIELLSLPGKERSLVTSQPEISSASFQNQQQAVSNYENAVFVSYAWESESERAVDELERAFAERGIHIIRDKKDLGYKGSIEAFEQRIGQGQCVVLVISDKYLRSEHCMCELVEVDKNRRLRERIFPIVLADAHIYKPLDRLNYINYWEQEVQKLNEALKEFNMMTNLAGIIADLDKYADIRTNFNHLTDLISDMNALTPERHAAYGFSTLIGSVERAMAGKQTVSQSSKGTAQLHEISDNRSEQLHSLWICHEASGKLWPKTQLQFQGQFAQGTSIEEGSPPGGAFIFSVIELDAEGQRQVENWLSEGEKSGHLPALTKIQGSARVAEVRLVLDKS